MIKLRYAIEAIDLTKKFGDFIAVNNLNLQVAYGEILGLLGPNGAGKTTTVRMIACLLKPTSGKIFVNGYDTVKEPEKVKQEIGYMPQRFSLYEDLTVMENLEFYGKIYGLSTIERKIKAKELLKFVELSGFENRLAGKLSGGMKQRLSLACALLHEPELLILDEPTAGIDPPLRRNFWEYFRELNKKGITLLITTHYMDEAENCKKIGIMDKGNLVKLGASEELKRSIYGGDVIEFCVNASIDQIKAVLSGSQDVLKIIPSNNSFLIVVEDSEKSLPTILEIFRKKGLNVLSARTIAFSLEDVFIKMTKG
ncbi:MAG: ATP-binding cassette domain-containing protein [Candidatus Bathyarchaeia archaeon]